MDNFKRIHVIVMDSVGICEAPDAAQSISGNPILLGCAISKTSNDLQIF
ncbi:hypothetical protein ACFFIX_17880 [Metabacillus herbersteinensis]|uniref:Metalloenzyme domain-containing protein n=1 Tax=Metabacillus herbersteinensis TaxID=283816 RepID=A0ABV6GJI2_9BACI